MDKVELNPREIYGRKIRMAAATLVGAPVALFLLVFYLRGAKTGHADRHAPLTMAAIAVSMALMPLIILGALNLVGVGTKD